MSYSKVGKEVGRLQAVSTPPVNRVYWIISEYHNLPKWSWWRSPSFDYMGNSWLLFLHFNGFLRESEEWVEVGIACSNITSLPSSQKIQIGIEGNSRVISKKHRLETSEHFFPLIAHSLMECQKDEYLFEGKIRLFFTIEETENISDARTSFEDRTNISKEEHKRTENTSSKTEFPKKEDYIGVQKLQKDLKEFLQNENISDVILNVSGQEFKSHRCILAARSPVFLAMMTHDTKERNTGIVDIEDIEPNTFSDFLNYLYTGSLERLTSDVSLRLYTAADKYQVNDLKQLCLDYMLKNISVENFCDVLTLSLCHEEKDLTEACYQFFSEKSLDIVLTTKWQMFLSENPITGNELFIKHLQLNK